MFKEVSSRTDFAKLEEEILQFWKENDIFRKSIEQRSEDNEYVTYDGPPFATGLPHYGHLVPGTIKDILPRYQTMKGKKVHRRFGWDCHGLPVEYEIEKTLGISGKSEIENFGVGKFNDECKSIVQRYTSQWKDTVNRMGRWVDFDNGYKTMDASYMESIWWVFKTLYEKGFIYEGYNILAYSPALASPLSNFEVNLGGYQDVVDQAVTVRFKVDNQDNTYFLAWTTTPWTLPSNLALALGKDIDYVKIKDNDDYYILAESRLGSYYKDENEYEIVQRYKGSELENIGYTPLFSYFEDLKNDGAFITVLADHVTTEDGTGIVHTAPGFGEEDYQALKNKGFKIVCPIDSECKFTSEVSDYENRFVKDCDKDIINRLKEENKLVKRENYLHSYPFCYRTNKPLIYRALNCWFVDVPKLKESMLNANSQIKWVPNHLKDGRFGKWLEGAREWAISRNRYWGNPIPVWKSDKSDYIEVIGSIKELEEKSGQKVTDLHKQYVDQLTWPAPDGGTMRRVGDILDCWFESGSMPYAQNHYPFENKELFESTYPADFICEGLDQTRGWFYTLTVIAAGLFDKPAFKNVITNGIVLTEDGKKMSKSLRNYTDPMTIVERYGADAMRFMLMNSGAVHAEDLKFSEEGVKDVIKNFILPIYNAYSFFVTYANSDSYQVSSTPFNNLVNNLDKWIYSETQTLVKNVTKALDDYDIQTTCQLLESFTDNLNNWYIRRSRRRFWDSEKTLDKKQAYDTLYYVLMTFSKISAPIVPFITETIYQNLKTSDDKQSIHLCDWPEYDSNSIDKELEKEVALIQKASSMGRALRASYNLKIRQPLSKCFVVSRNTEETDIIKKHVDTLYDELNVKEVEILSDESHLVTYSAKANFKVLGKIFGKDMKECASKIALLTHTEISNILDGNTYNITIGETSYDISENDLVITREQKENVQVANDGSLTVGFDTQLTQDLILEGIARDLIRLIQNTRKEENLNVSDRIKLRLITNSELLNQAIKKGLRQISSETLSEQVYIVHKDGELDLNNEFVSIQVIKV